MFYLIIGLGKSGLSAAEFLEKRGQSVVIFDDCCEKYLSENVLKLIENGAEIFDEKKHLLTIKKAVISPGVSPQHSLVKKLNDLNIEVIAELELGLFFTKNKTVAITGTNGKSTVCSLISHVLNYLNIPSICVGNIGYPITKYLMRADLREVLIVEVSSFQLEKITKKIFFDISLILNIFAHHLDRHENFEKYAETKLSLQTKTKKLYVSKGIYDKYKSYLSKCDVYEENTWGVQDFFDQNLSAAFAVCKEFKISKEHFLSALRSFQSLPHRMEMVATINGVEYFNDSKATNPNAVMQALERFNKKIILIAGGYDSCSDFTIWRKVFPDKIKIMIAIGQCKNKIFETLFDLINVVKINDLKDAFSLVNKVSVKGDIVLFSPGCQSFDQFKNFEDRGNSFKQLVMALKERGQ